VRVLYVTPRWGAGIAGGAERAARAWALRLARRGHEVRAITTAASSLTWETDLAPGEEDDEGVRVLRRPARTSRSPEALRALTRLAAGAALRTPAEGRRLLELQGPLIDGLEEAVAWAEVVVAYPYLYWTTLRAAELATRRCVVHPAAHPEPLLTLRALAPVFERVGGLVYQTDAERRIVEATWRCGTARTAHLVPPVAAERSEDTPEPHGRTIVLAVGRYERAKGSRALEVLARALPEPLEVVAVGPVVEPPPLDSPVRTLGVIPDEQLHALRAQALVTVVLSQYESFSLAAAESLAAGVPIVVNAANEALVELATHSGGGFVAEDGIDVAAWIDLLQHEPDAWRAASQAGQAWARATFNEARAVDRYEAFLAAVARAATRQRR
jgi:glycosyltransferase involved in cell wall biosynthesis